MKEIGYFRDLHAPLAPAMLIGYEREAYRFSSDGDLRLTFDGKIRWRDEDLSLDSGGGLLGGS